jgi:serine/threonine protein phosphatase PrpC
MGGTGGKKNPLHLDRWELTKKKQALMKKVMIKAFEDIHQLVCTRSGIDVKASGATLSVILIEGETLYSANVGDSKAMLIWDSKFKYHQKNKQDQAPQANITILTATHQPSDPKEKLRIQRANGEIRIGRGQSQSATGDQSNLRIYFKKKDYPGISISRSIGDTDAHTLGVWEVPGKTTYTLTTQ